MITADFHASHPISESTPTRAHETLSFRAVYQLHQKIEARRQRRLGGCSIAAILAITGMGLWLVSTIHSAPSRPYAPPPAAIAIDLAPEPVSVPAPPQIQPPGPPPLAIPEPPAPEKPPEVMAPPSPAPLPPVPVPQKIKVEPARRKKAPSPPIPRHLPSPVPTQSTANTAPPPSEAPPSNISATSAKGTPSTREKSQAKASWQGSLLARLEHFKRYPAQAQAEHQEGTVMLRFTMDRKGHVLSAALARPTGYALLDEETLALVRRAEPLPAPPETITGATLTLTVPVEFYMEAR